MIISFYYEILHDKFNVTSVMCYVFRFELIWSEENDITGRNENKEARMVRSNCVTPW